MWFLLVVTLIVILIIVSSSGKGADDSADNPSYYQVQDALKQRDKQWREYITAFRDRLSSTKDKALFDELLQGASYHSLSDDAAADEYEQLETAAPSASASHSITDDYQARHSPAEASAKQPVTAKPPIDNALLLLYLGAFLFVASAGLFVAFAGFSGGVRTLIVALVAILFYAGGLHLFDNKPKLKQAGISFTAIGMAIAPLIGLSYYGYVLDGTAGPLVWFATSLGVMGLYLHALLKLRSTFVSYLLIFSFVSMLQSTVSIMDAPTYFFIWMLVVTGLVLRLVARYASSIDITELESSSRISAQIIIPIGIVVSLISVGTQGTLQLAITFFIASLYYAVEGVEDVDESNRLGLWQAAHALFIAGVAIASFSISESINHATISLLVLGALHALYLMRPLRKLESMSPACGVNALAAVLIALALSVTEPWLLLAALGVLAGLGLVLALSREDIAGMFFAMFAFGVMPVVYGGYVLDPGMAADQLALFSAVGPLLIVGLRALLQQRQLSQWLPPTAVVVMLASLIPATVALWATSATIALFVYVLLALQYAYLGIYERQKDWMIASGVFITGFVLYGWIQGVNPVLSLSIIIAVAWNIALALHYGREVTRWIGSVLWFFLPIALLAPGWQTLEPTSSDISWVYIGTVTGFVLARAIARGVILRSKNKSMQTFEAAASYSYFLGYYAAAVAGLLFGLGADDLGLHISLYVALLIGFEYVRSVYVEKNAALAATIPLLLQILLLAWLSPISSDTTELNIYLAWSTFAAAAMFLPPYLSPEKPVVKTPQWETVAAAMLFLTPLSVLLAYKTVVMMPIGLLVAGVLILYRNREKSQDSRELTSTLLVAALMWFMWYFGVTNLQAYTHVLAAVIAGYAYWRHAIGDREQSDKYLMTMFFVATIPLALQALSGTSGDIYGWWLILEQVGFILLGMAIGRPFLIKWGLYVSVAAVLYQLRHLGWAALAVLAVFVIGLALHFLNRQGDDNDAK